MRKEGLPREVCKTKKITKLRPKGYLGVNQAKVGKNGKWAECSRKRSGMCKG